VAFPDVYVKRFTDDGRYLICFSRHQQVWPGGDSTLFDAIQRYLNPRSTLLNPRSTLFEPSFNAI